MADQWLHKKGRVEVRTHKLRISGHKKRTKQFKTKRKQTRAEDAEVLAKAHPEL